MYHFLRMLVNRTLADTKISWVGAANSQTGAVLCYIHIRNLPE